MLSLINCEKVYSNIEYSLFVFVGINSRIVETKDTN